MKKAIILILLASFIYAQDSGSLFSDFKAAQVGDVLSVIIVEHANASRESKSKSDSQSETKIGAQSSGNIVDFLPVFGGKGELGSSYTGSDGTEQKERLTGRITVTIIEKSSNGLFKIKGERTLNVNGEENLMRLEGFVRAKDITGENTVYSYNIAGAEITYRKSGLTNSFLKPGTMSSLFTWMIGGLMVAASAGYFAFK
jgi:flagellar L-ring protein precursor FlgH